MLDSIDRKLLAELQKGSTVTAQELAGILGLSASQVATMREATGCWTLTGPADYLLRVWCADLAALNELIQHRLLPHPAVARVESKIVMEELKPDSGLPVP